MLPPLDGTGLANGDVDLQAFLSVADQVLQRLEAGQSALVCCKKGAHRSATGATALIMRYSGVDATVAGNYIFPHSAT